MVPRWGEIIPYTERIKEGARALIGHILLSFIWITFLRAAGDLPPRTEPTSKETSMNIYVGNISRDVTETELKDAFAAFGMVQSASIIKEKYTGESRGFGFVEMPNKEEADKALAELNGKDLKGRNLTVNEAKPRTDRPRSGGGFGGGRPSGGRGGFGGGRRF